MKIFAATIFIFSLSTFSWLNRSANDGYENAAHNISQSYFNDFRLFQKEVDKLANLTSDSQNKTDLPLLKNQLIETRLAYKKIEFLFDYYQTSYNYHFINGGPLTKLYEESMEIIEPNGLQTLDEIIFSENANEQLDHIKKLAQELKIAISRIAQNHLKTNFTDRRIIEALRSGIVRIFTLGITGFDTPGCANGMQETLISLKAMEKTFLFFGKNVKPGAKAKFHKIETLYHKGKHFLTSNDDFDSFDRMAFLKQIVNPIYKNLLDFQSLSEIETTQFKYHFQDYNSQNIFDEDFLSTERYSEFSFLPLNNPSTIELGKTLFYDPILSNDIKMSCASCHDPANAFTDGLAKSKANISGTFTQRNTPTLIDAGYASRYFWDLRDYNLERQVAHVVNNTLEFNTGFNEIAERLYQSETYVQMFEASYKGIAKKAIYNRSISNAIAAYVNSLKSFNSEFDRYARNEISVYPEEAIRGFNLFMGKAACGTCHFAPVFNGTVPPFYKETESEVLGITLGFDTIQPQKDLDPGRFQNGLKKDARPHFENSFKTVTVRNAELTAPYMHNGLFKTLEEVLEFYNRGGGAGMGLKIENQTLSAAPLNLTEIEKNDIISFLHTLTDTTGLTSRVLKLPEFEKRPEWNNRGY